LYFTNTLWDKQHPHFYVEEKSLIGFWKPIKNKTFDEIKYTNNAKSSYEHTLKDYLGLNPKKPFGDGLCLDYI